MPTMKTLKFHTLHGQEHHEGDLYEVDDSQVENLVGQGMAVLAYPPEPRAAQPSHQVDPMTTKDFNG